MMVYFIIHNRKLLEFDSMSLAMAFLQGISPNDIFSFYSVPQKELEEPGPNQLELEVSNGS